MTGLSVIGLQWGDEGKGKIVDCLSGYVDVVARFQGGNNAGHTLLIDGNIHKMNLLPSGIARENVLSIITQGVVVDPYALIAEINDVSFKVTPHNLIVSENCHLVLSLHKKLDALYEGWRNNKIGTTCKGIGPCYEDKVARRGIRICDLYGDQDYLGEALEQLLLYHNAIRKGSDIGEVTKAEIMAELTDIADQIAPYVTNHHKIIDILSVKKVLYEGAQGCLLDIDYGTYPFVTSSTTVKACSMTESDYVLGIAKAYVTRVGYGPFPTEQSNAIGDMLRSSGKEIGTVSGRPRRCGWFDAVIARYTTKVSGAHGIALTKLDILDGMDQIKICTHYEYNGQRCDYLPSSDIAQQSLTPVYEELPGWKQATSGMTNFEDLPSNARAYVRRIEELLNLPVIMISTGAARNDIIMITECD